MKNTYLIIPGYTNSGPEHWQSYIESKYVNVIRVTQDNWLEPDNEKWVARLNSVISETTGNLVLVGHSCGSVTITQWAVKHVNPRVKAAILVAPADVDAPDALEAIQSQRPLPQFKLPFPSLVICSNNDQHLSLQRALFLADRWGSELKMIPNAGHIHTAAGFGEWCEGEELIKNFSGIDFHLK